MAKLKSRTKQRGYPDRRGLWAESDTIVEQFVPSERHKAQQKVMAQTLTAAGLNREQIASVLSVPVDLPSDENLADVKPRKIKPAGQS